MLHFHQFAHVLTLWWKTQKCLTLKVDRDHITACRWFFSRKSFRFLHLESSTFFFFK